MSIKDWTDEDDDKVPDPSSFSEQERELLKDATPRQIKLYGQLDRPTLEAMIVGMLIGPPNVDKADCNAAEKVVEAGIKPDWFEDKIYKDLFSDFLSYYKENRELLKVDEAQLVCLNQGQTKTEGNNYTAQAYACLGALKARKIRVELLIGRMLTYHLMKLEDRIYQKAVEDRANPAIGPQKSWENMREACIRDLVDLRGAVIKEFDFINDDMETLSWLKDMKHNPEKYRGAMSGIKAIDRRVIGFRKGQLTVFCAPPGGYKTTMMLNLAYGLWEQGFNVLYASLEMEALNVKTKLLCRGARKISYSRVYSGKITEPEDDPKAVADIMALKASLVTATPEEAIKIEAQIDAIASRFESYIAEKYYKEQQAKRKNLLKIINVGQSQKIKLSQLERYLFEQSTKFKPDVVLLDYLDLVSPEVVNQNRLDVGFGDVCKMSRAIGLNMGFSVITAAQMKRTAIDRLRKHGFDSPEKAAFGVDDIAGSAMIGNDADNCFVIWKQDGGTTLKLFTIKSRYGGVDSNGETLQVDHDTCTISDDKIEDVDVITRTKTMADAYSSAAKANKPLYTRMPEEDGEEDMIPISPLGGDDMGDDVIAGPIIAPSEADQNIGDL